VPLSVYTGVETFRNEFDIVRSTLNRPSGPLPIGAGFLGWKLEEPDSVHIDLLKLALENGVQAIWFSFGEDLGRWIEFVRIHDQQSAKTPRTLIFVQVNSVDEALLAVQTWKVDVLVAQGMFFFLWVPFGSRCVPMQKKNPQYFGWLSPLVFFEQETNRGDMARLLPRQS
jgi:hypothetical protein